MCLDDPECWATPEEHLWRGVETNDLGEVRHWLAKGADVLAPASEDLINAYLEPDYGDVRDLRGLDMVAYHIRYHKRYRRSKLLYYTPILHALLAAALLREGIPHCVGGDGRYIARQIASYAFPTEDE